LEEKVAAVNGTCHVTVGSQIILNRTQPYCDNRTTLAGKAVAFNGTCSLTQSTRFKKDIYRWPPTPLWENCTQAIAASVAPQSPDQISVPRSKINDRLQFYIYGGIVTFVDSYNVVELNILLLMEISFNIMGDIGMDPTVQAFCGLSTCKANIYSYLDAHVPKCQAVWFLETYWGTQIVNAHELIARSCCAYDVAIARNKIWSSACKADLNVPAEYTNQSMYALVTSYNAASDNGLFGNRLCQSSTCLIDLIHNVDTFPSCSQEALNTRTTFFAALNDTIASVACNANPNQLVNAHELIARTTLLTPLSDIQCAYYVDVAKNKTWSTTCINDLNLPMRFTNGSIHSTITSYDMKVDKGILATV